MLVEHLASGKVTWLYLIKKPNLLSSVEVLGQLFICELYLPVTELILAEISILDFALD